MVDIGYRISDTVETSDYIGKRRAARHISNIIIHENIQLIYNLH
jgi:hypothetical protein